MQNIQRSSYYLRIIFQFAFVLIAFMFVGSWLSSYLGLAPMPRQAFSSFLQGGFWTVTTLLFLYLFTQLFRSYEKGEVFTLKNTILLRNIGLVLLAKEIIPSLYLSLFKLNIFYGLTHIDIVNVIIAAVIILNSWITAESYKLKTEQQLTV